MSGAPRWGLAAQMTSLAWSGHQGALKGLQPLFLRLNLTSGKPPQRALQDVLSEVLTEEGKAPGPEERF